MWNHNFSHTSPLFNPIVKAFQRSSLSYSLSWPQIKDYNRLLHAQDKVYRSGSGKELQFVPQCEKSNSFTKGYEPRIYLQGEIQTRLNNWHDFFNALVWVTFPKMKSAINTHHFVEQKKRWGKSKQRTHIENLLAGFDENGAIVLSTDKRLTELMLNHRWIELFVENREAVIANMRFIIFGHSLYEKTLNPYIGMTASSVIVEVDDLFLQQSQPWQLDILDQQLASNIMSRDQLLKMYPLKALPVLGVPGWWPENNDSEFYRNADYFRPAKLKVAV